ncbi:MAG TPA: nucleotide sugar dehydrogenase [Candidatus Limnocylindria bacterium]|nr:nucleotide sugar dehydrogenase [Candidatus Limnocylindria bacterium]
MNADAPIAIIGLGYVGLPLALQFAERGARVLGLDIDSAKVQKLNRGDSYILHIPGERVAAARQRGGFEAVTDFSVLSRCQAVIICVPTPLKGENEPDLSYVLNTGRSLAPYIHPSMLVVLESTTYPGTTDEELRAVLEAGSGMVAGRDFHLAYSPEREDPGNPASQLSEIPKVVGGLTPPCRDRAMALYLRIVKTVVPVANCRVAEAVKLTENIFRAVNIAMVNELKLVYEAMGIDVWDVIEAAKTKPFGYMPFYPGPGLGGHCIPIDPFYLTWKARQFGQETRFIELAGEVNTAMPAHVVERTAQALQLRGLTLQGSRILLLGIAYKPDVDDDRESPGYVLWNLFEAQGAQVDYHDPHIPEIRPSREHSHYAGRKSLELDAGSVTTYDVVVLVTQHRAVDYDLVAREARLIVDTRNVFGRRALPPERYVKA